MSDVEHDLSEFVEGKDGISVIRTKQVLDGENFRGWNGIRYKAGLSAKNVNAEKLSMNVATVAPGAIAYAHIHDGFELMLYIPPPLSAEFSIKRSLLRLGEPALLYMPAPLLA